jgi:hypothetical protein
MVITWGTHIPEDEDPIKKWLGSNLASPWKMCPVLSRLSGPAVLLSKMPLVLLCLDLPDLTTTTLTGTIVRTGTMVSVRVKETSNKIKLKAIKTATDATSTSPTCMT